MVKYFENFRENIGWTSTPCIHFCDGDSSYVYYIRWKYFKTKLKIRKDEIYNSLMRFLKNVLNTNILRFQRDFNKVLG